MENAPAWQVRGQRGLSSSSKQGRAITRGKVAVVVLDQNLLGNWAAWASTINAPGYYQTLSGYSDCGSFTETDFNNVERQLYRHRDPHQQRSERAPKCSTG